MAHKDNLAPERLKALLRKMYGIDALLIIPARRGFYGETWRVDTAEGSYFVKSVSLAFHRPVYEQSFPVIDYMRRRGIDFISKIVKTRQGALFLRDNLATIGVFEWIDGENRQDETSKRLEYDMLSRIYAVSEPGLRIPQEDFSTAKAALFFRQWAALRSLPHDTAVQAICELLAHHRNRFIARSERLAIFSNRCRDDCSPCFITHGDAGGNVILNGNRSYLVDWDDPIYAPPERDAWFCLHWDWAMRAFQESLERQHIQYSLRPDRLAYYCYHAFFWYLTLYLQTCLEVRDRGNLADELSAYLNGWIEDNIRFADTMT